MAENPRDRKPRPGGVDRRSFLARASKSAIAVAVLTFGGRPTFADGDPIVETTSGKIRGVSAAGALAFKGVPYGASTAGSNRFMAAAPARALDRGPGCRRLCRACAAMAIDHAPARRDQDFARAPRHDADRGGLPDVESVDAGPGQQGEAPGHGLAARRRNGLRLRQPARLRWNQSGAARRRGRRRRQPSAQRLRLSASRRYRRRGLCAFGQRRNPRSRGRAALGARQHRAVRRRSRQCHDLRTIRRRRKGQHASRDAGGSRPLSPRDHPERCRHPVVDARTRQRTGRGGAHGAGTRQERVRPAAGRPGKNADRGVGAGPGGRGTERLAAARPVRFRAGGRRRRSSGSSPSTRRHPLSPTTSRW